MEVNYVLSGFVVSKKKGVLVRIALCRVSAQGCKEVAGSKTLLPHDEVSVERITEELHTLTLSTLHKKWRKSL
jgi:hypothetical protein